MVESVLHHSTWNTTVNNLDSAWLCKALHVTRYISRVRAKRDVTVQKTRETSVMKRHYQSTAASSALGSETAESSGSYLSYSWALTRVVMSLSRVAMALSRDTETGLSRAARSVGGVLQGVMSFSGVSPFFILWRECGLIQGVEFRYNPRVNYHYKPESHTMSYI